MFYKKYRLFFVIVDNAIHIMGSFAKSIIAAYNGFTINATYLALRCLI